MIKSNFHTRFPKVCGYSIYRSYVKVHPINVVSMYTYNAYIKCIELIIVCTILNFFFFFILMIDYVQTSPIIYSRINSTNLRWFLFIEYMYKFNELIVYGEMARKKAFGWPQLSIWICFVCMQHIYSLVFLIITPLAG